MRNSFTWNGETSDAAQLTDGVYQLSINAVNDNGEALSFTVEMSGRVDRIIFTDSRAQLVVGEIKVPIEDVLTITGPDLLL